jgi:hypothetical protein
VSSRDRGGRGRRGEVRGAGDRGDWTGRARRPEQQGKLGGGRGRARGEHCGAGEENCEEKIERTVFYV